MRRWLCVQLGVVLLSGRLRLLPNYGDPDDWDGELGFERESGAVAP